MNRVCVLLFAAAIIALAEDPQDNRTAIAVMDFQTKNLENPDISGIFSERLRAEVFRTGSVRLVERSIMDEILREQGFQQSGCTSQECIVQIGQLLGVQEIISGAISRIGRSVTVTARRVSVQTGEILAVATCDLQGPVEDLVNVGIPSIVQQLTGEFQHLQGTRKLTGMESYGFSPLQLCLFTPVQVVPRKYSIYGISINCLYGQNAQVGGISAGLINHSKVMMAGISAGLINVSPRAIGIQAGLINITHKLTGIQVGLINIVKGRKRAPVVPVMNIGI